MRFESDCHLLQKRVRSGTTNGEAAKKEALRLLGDARVYWAKVLDYLDELTKPDLTGRDSPRELLDRCSRLEDAAVKAEQKASTLGDLVGLLLLQNQMLQDQLKQECRKKKQLEREFEKIGREDFGRLVEPFLTKGMFQKHAKR